MQTMTLETRKPFAPATLSDAPRVTPGPFPEHARQTMCLVGSTAKHASYADVCDPASPLVMALPEVTYRTTSTGREVESYVPLSYAVQIDSIRDTVSAILGSEPAYEVYALNNRGDLLGAHMFGKIAWQSDIPGTTIEVVLRSSLDGTIKLQWGTGIGTFICANGMIQAENLISIKHTKNIEERFAASLIDPEIGAMARIEAARERAQWVDGLKEIPMSDDLFHAFLGVLRGRKIMGRNGSHRSGSRACTVGRRTERDPDVGRSISCLPGCATRSQDHGAQWPPVIHSNADTSQDECSHEVLGGVSLRRATRGAWTAGPVQRIPGVDGCRPPLNCAELAADLRGY